MPGAKAEWKRSTFLYRGSNLWIKDSRRAKTIKQIASVWLYIESIYTPEGTHCPTLSFTHPLDLLCSSWFIYWQLALGTWQIHMTHFGPRADWHHADPADSIGFRGAKMKRAGGAIGGRACFKLVLFRFVFLVDGSVVIDQLLGLVTSFFLLSCFLLLFFSPFLHFLLKLPLFLITALPSPHHSTPVAVRGGEGFAKRLLCFIGPLLFLLLCFIHPLLFFPF